MIPVEETVAILARVAASSPTAPSDEASLHLRIVRALDVFAARGLTVAPERVVPRIAASFDDTSLLDLMVSVIVESERAGEAIVLRARELAPLSDPGLPDEAGAALGFRRVLLDPAQTIGRYLPRDVVMQNDFRREELIRAWAAAIGLPLEVANKPEPREKSARMLERLDYRRIRADEERLSIEHRVLAEHAEAVREKQRRDAEALASAQRE